MLRGALKALLARTPWVVQRRGARRGLGWLEDLGAFMEAGAPRVFLDAGAHEGQTARALRGAFPAAEIHCFEPTASTAERLRRNAAGDARIFVHARALGREAGTAEIVPQKYSQTNSLKPSLNVPGAAAAAAERVEVDTLDRFAAARGIGRVDLLKMDVEGYEIEVLRGGAGLLGDGRIDWIFSETGLRPDDERHTPLDHLLAHLRPAGFSLFALYDLPHRSCPPEAEYGNALFVRVGVRAPLL